jgi:CheY-like chemotaxis protein
MNKPRVLVACTTPAIQTVQQLLGADVDTIAARSLAEALERLGAQPDLILCNVRFDESRMLDLLQAAKAQPATRDTPFVCFRLRPAPAAWHRSVEVAVQVAGAAAFVDLSSLELERGREAAQYELRQIVLSHLPH